MTSSASEANEQLDDFGPITKNALRIGRMGPSLVPAGLLESIHYLLAFIPCRVTGDPADIGREAAYTMDKSSFQAQVI